MKKIKSWFLFLFVGLAMWQIIAYSINNVFILPSPFLVIQQMISFLSTKTFYISTFYTLTRILISIIVSLFCGLFFAFVSLKWKWIDEIFSKILLILRSLPNVTIIILLLFWISREMTVFLVSFLLLFPIIYQNIISSLKEIQMKWKEVMTIYPQSYWYQIRWIYFPLLKTSLYASLISCSSLGFKVGIMAEILGQVQNGIGRQIQYYRVNFELDKVMAWTIWILVIVFLFDFLFKFILKILFDDSYTLFFRKKSDKLNKR